MSDTIVNSKPQTDLRTADFDYELPRELIAQSPAPQRDASRLMVLHRDTGDVEHRHFSDITDYLRPQDVLVINDSKVIPARLYGHVEGRPEATLELLLLRQRGLNLWEVLVKPGKRARVGMRAVFGDGMLTGEVTEIAEEGNRLIRFSYDESRYGSIYDILHRIGLMPLPPYITEQLRDNDRYQTVYAREEGSAAAPTAGLHFTPELLDRIRQMGVAIAPVLLHVGLGTFRPVKAERVEEHRMDAERYHVPEATARAIDETRAAGGRVIAVGSTSVRTLETVAAANGGRVVPCSGESVAFIYPPYRFLTVDAMLTNFHLPQSTLIMMVSALAGRERILEAYREAVRARYRFFSYGDCMLIL